MVEYDPTYVDPENPPTLGSDPFPKWTDDKIAEEIEDIGFEAEVLEKSEIVEVALRVYG